MNATTSLDSPILRKNSVLFWCTLVVPAGIIALGINFILGNSAVHDDCCRISS